MSNPLDAGVPAKQFHDDFAVDLKRLSFLPSLVFLVGAIAALVGASKFRFLETKFAASSFGWSGLGQADYLGGDQLLAYDLGVPVRFTVTQQCGVMLLIAPLMFSAAIVVRSAYAGTFRVSLAALGSSALLIFANQVRLSLIGWTIRLIGFDQGFPLGHLVFGTILSIVAVIASIIMFARLVRAEAPKRPNRPRVQPPSRIGYT